MDYVIDAFGRFMDGARAAGPATDVRPPAAMDR
jgi:hypothetical protein